MLLMGLVIIYKGKLIFIVNLILEIEKSNKLFFCVYFSIFIYCKLVV